MGEVNNDLLQKAHSLAVHLGRMTKAVGSFHDSMTKLHKVHADDMNAAVATLHKMVGSGGASEDKGGGGTLVGFKGTDQPTPTNLQSEGTESLVHFDRAMEPVGLQKGLQKGGFCPDCGKPLVDGECPTCDKVARAQVTKADIKAIVDEGMNAFFATFAKAFASEVEQPDPTDNRSPLQRIVETSNGKAAGIGDRNQLRQPVQQVVKAVEITPPGPVNTEQEKPITSDLAKRALDGDLESQLEFMKSAKPQTELPATLVQTLSKIH